MPEFRKIALENRKERRGELDIIADILSHTFQPISKTRIMYQANLSFTQLKGYIKRLKDSGLIEEKNSPLTYRITEKGKKFLIIYSEIMEILYPEQ
jgi:predicted transcriptional regulator